MRRFACFLAALFVVCSPLGPDGSDPGPDPSDAPRLASVLPGDAVVRIETGGRIEFHVAATSPREKPLAITFLVDGIPRSSSGTFVFSPAAEGTYRVTAVVTDGELETTHEWTVTVEPPPNIAPTAVLSLEPASGRAPLAVRARVQGADPDGQVVRYRLELTGPTAVGIDRSAAIDTVLLLPEGSWQATATVEDDRGATASATRGIQVAPPNLPPLARLQADPVTGPAPLDVLVDASGSDPDGEVAVYRLDANGDGGFEIESSAPIRSFVRYESPGTYRLALSLIDDAGAEARDSLEIQVSHPPAPPPPPPGNAAPVASLSLTPVEGEAPLVVDARVTAVDPDGVVSELRIDFDADGEADATVAGAELVATFRFEAAGEYTVRATAVDDDGALDHTVATVTVRPSRNEPPTGALSVDVTRGDAPLEVRISASGSDPDGRIVRWELDADEGAGFVELEAAREATLVYAFREDPYRPRLRVTDDGGATLEVNGPAIFVHLPVSGGSASVAGNPRFDPTAIAPAVWSDGRDAWRFQVTVRGSEGEPLEGVAVRASPTRAELSAPDGTSLGPAVALASPAPRTGPDGVASGTLVTTLSTRIERAPVIAFQPFSVVFEADAGHGEWREVARVDGLNANTVVSAAASRVLVFPSNVAVCPGTPLEIEVQARAVPDAPVPGAAAGRYAELRYADGTLLAATPKPEWSAWRTDAAGVVRFGYSPTRADQSRLVKAWVDGQPLDELGLIALRPVNECGS